MQKIKSINFNEPDLITCFANDYGYENWCKEALNFYADKGDLLILISCSGKSKNLVNANKFALKKKINVVTLTGCSKKNYLNTNKKNKVNIWINSDEYNVIEAIHHLILLSIVDGVMKKNEKKIFRLFILLNFKILKQDNILIYGSQSTNEIKKIIKKKPYILDLNKNKFFYFNRNVYKF